MKNSEKKSLREIKKQITLFRNTISDISEEVVNRCDIERERNENSEKIDKFEEEENVLDTLNDDLDTIQDDIQLIIDGVGL